MTLPNIVAVGVYDSQIAVKKSVSKNRRTTMFEIELPLENGGISYIDANSWAIRPNMLICAKPDQLRHTKFPFKCLYIHMIVPEGQLADVLRKTPDVVMIQNYETYHEIFTKMIKFFNLLSLDEEIFLQSLVLELIYTISKETAKQYYNRKGKNNALLIEQAIEYIKAHLTEDLCLETVAGEMSLSPVYFHKTFKASTGKNLRDFIEQERIKKAIHLLQTTDQPLTKIAYECGFSSQSYFSFVFKRRMKMTPREYVQTIYNKYEL